MNISIDHLSRLARLALTEEEKARYGDQLDNILCYVGKLNELDTAGVEPTSHVISISNVMREDTLRPSLDREEALMNAPDKTDAFYRVPKIIE
ncbi:MAG: Asp-tRNA(Asn)/Glu-tRNA(Gln) amidotransferase subunit GatC [Nitrospirota bacterium]|nr:Asp-tRNA(Asn)/Glu-tRNA(Gln) amidotransferase subunit GatC [Nitrospirota bacterium]